MTEITLRDHADELRNMHTCLLAGGADWSDVLLDAATEVGRLRTRVAELEEELANQGAMHPGDSPAEIMRLDAMGLNR